MCTIRALRLAGAVARLTIGVFTVTLRLGSR
jgi:hypothetical protein